QQELAATPDPETSALAYEVERLVKSGKGHAVGDSSAGERGRDGPEGADRDKALTDGRRSRTAHPAWPAGASAASPRLPVPPSQLEPVGGAVPVASAFYVLRPTDVEFCTAIARQ